MPFLERAARTAHRPVEVEGLTFHDTLCITQIHGGVARNVVPDRVELALNVRFAPGREAAAARAEIEQLVAGEGELTWLDESPAASPALSEPLLARFIAETGVRVLPKQAWTDVASLQAHGIPAVNYGPGEAHQAHQPGEWVDGEAIAQRRDHARPLPAHGLMATVAAMRIAKWQALGNHFLTCEEPPWPITPARARLLCDAALGLGADGVLELTLGADDVTVVVHNRDGSIAEVSGNGTRIAAAYAAERLGATSCACTPARAQGEATRARPTAASPCGSGRRR